MPKLQWCKNNKLLIFLGLITFCLLISTIVLSTKLNKASGCSVPSDRAASLLKNNIKLKLDNTVKKVRICKRHRCLIFIIFYIVL